MSAGYDGPPLDQRRLLSALHRHHVDYLVIGGVAAQAHGAQRATQDLDCVPDTSTDNLARLAGALRELHTRLRVGGMLDEEARSLPLQLDAQSLAANTVWNFTTDAGAVDILQGLPDASGRRQSYAELLPRSEARAYGGVTVRVAALSDIIDSKQWANRPKDHQALPELIALQHPTKGRPSTGPPPLPHRPRDIDYDR